MGRSTCEFGSGPNPVIAATRALFSSKGPRVPWVRSPEDEGDRRRERGDDKAEVDPGPISLGVLGKHEKMDHDPQTDPKSQRKPDEIAGGLVNGRKGLALGASHAHGHDHERPDKQRTQSHTQYPQSQRDGRWRRSDVGWIELLRFGAHKVAVADPSVSGARLYVCKVYVRSVAPPAMPATNGDKFPAWRGVAEHRTVACKRAI